MFPGMSFTVDYYRIHVKQLIATLSAQTIINSCYDLPSTNNPFCPLINRAATTTSSSTRRSSPAR